MKKRHRGPGRGQASHLSLHSTVAAWGSGSGGLLSPRPQENQLRDLLFLAQLSWKVHALHSVACSVVLHDSPGIKELLSSE